MNFTWATLKDIATFQPGSALAKKDAIPGGVPIVGGGGTIPYTHNQSNRTPPTITIASAGTAGLVSYWDRPIYATNCFTIHLNQEVIPKYCYYYLAKIQNKLFDLQRGGGLPHVFPRDIGLIKIPIPYQEEPARSYAVQQEIVEILDGFADTEKGLAAALKEEIALREKQYRYYRNRLFGGTP